MVAEERHAGFRCEMQRRGLPVDGPLLVTHERWAESMDAVFSLETDLDAALNAGATAIFASSDLYAAGAVRLLGQRGLNVPGDISVIGYDDSLLARAYNPPLATVAQDVAAASKVAIEMLVSRIRTGQHIPSRMVPARLVLGHSTAPRAAVRDMLQGLA